MGLLTKLLLGGLAASVIFSDEQVQPPGDINELKLYDFETLTEKLKDKGFSNIKTVRIEDLIDGEVETVTIDNRTDYDEYTSFDPDAEVIIEYHTFPIEEIKQESENNTEYNKVRAPSDPDTLEEIEKINSSELNDLNTAIREHEIEEAKFSDMEDSESIDNETLISAVNNTQINTTDSFPSGFFCGVTICLVILTVAKLCCRIFKKGLYGKIQYLTTRSN